MPGATYGGMPPRIGKTTGRGLIGSAMGASAPAKKAMPTRKPKTTTPNRRR